MAERILFVVEGEKAEKQILENLGKVFFKDALIRVVFEGEIYQLAKSLADDEYLDAFELLRERSEANRQTLADFTRDDFSQIYLFFDYDGQVDVAPFSPHNRAAFGDQRILQAYGGHTHFGQVPTIRRE